ncbi:hypothetical protein SDC9_206298 [bioreactor metagenome]|uniref:Uncharacterized protein n=1 Tax=bioreactor metagenome TaxID=1076179 RepID=A0A645J4M1_9ZZZZ
MQVKQEVTVLKELFHTEKGISVYPESMAIQMLVL